MKRNILYYILPLLTAFVSCSDDYMGNYPGNSGEGSTSISLEIDVPETRTRAIDMTPGAALYLNDIWVGVYRQGNGHRHAGTKNNEPIDLQHRMTASGVKLTDLVQIESTTDETLDNTGADFVIVGVANSKDVKTIDGKDLSQALKEADTWEKFVNIAIDTKQEFYAHTPVLMGYLQPEATDASTSQYVYTKVDQFKAFSSINLVGSTTTGNGSQNNNVWIRPQTVTNGKINSFNTTGYLMKLRRLRSKINVNISSKENVYITNLDYKIFNLPKSAFLAQRRANTFSEPGKEGATYSPNSSDVNGDGYYNSESWTTPANNYSFSYEHFENKHWALPDASLDEYHDREAHSGNTVYGENKVETLDVAEDKPVFNVLAETADNWNNNATYMVIRMKIRDENTGRYGDVYYTVHEGFINDEDGIATSDIDTRLKDFTCIRNTDYYYNICVNGMNDIVTTVSSNQTSSHLNDQVGSIWQMDYAKVENSHINQVLVTGESQYIEITKEIKFDANADIAFRLIGNWGGNDPHAVDICYNFARGELDNFAGLWAAPNNSTTEYLVGLGNVGEENYTSPYEAMENYFEANKDTYINQLLNGIKIKVKYVDGYKTVKEYIEYINDEDNTNKDKEGFKDIEGFIYYKMDLASDLPNPEDYLRGLYIFDRKEAIEGKYIDEDGKSHANGKYQDGDGCIIYQIYAAEQYPSNYKKTINFTEADMIPTSLLYTNLNGDSNHWVGGRDVGTELIWRHKKGIIGYNVEVLKPGEEYTKYDMMEINSTDLQKYLRENPKNPWEQIVVCPFTTPRLSPNKQYSIKVTPICDTEHHSEPVVFENALIVNTGDNGIYDFSKGLLATLSGQMFEKSNLPISYNGLVINQNPTHKNQKFPAELDIVNKYIQFGGNGSVKNRNFSLILYREGTIKIEVRSNGGSDVTDRNISIYEEGNPNPIFTSTGGLKKDNISTVNGTYTSSPITYDVNPTKPTRYYITCDKDCRYFKIEFVRKN